MSQDDFSILPSLQAKSHSVGRLTDPVLEHAPRERLRAAPRQGWMRQITQLMPPGNQKVNTSHSQSAPANLTHRKGLGQYLHSVHCRRALGQPWSFRTALVLQGQTIHPVPCQDDFCTAQ